MWTAMPKVKQENFFLAVKQAEAAFGIKVQLASSDCLEHVWRVWPRNMDGQLVKKTYKVFVYVPVPILISSSLGVLWNNIQSVYQRDDRQFLLPGSASFAVHLGSRSPGHDQHQGLLFYPQRYWDARMLIAMS